MNCRVEVLVVGAGPAGIAAACTAAQRGKRVAIVDDNFQPGGQIWRKEQLGQSRHISQTASHWLRRLQTVGSSITQFFECRVFDAPAPGVLHAEQQGKCIELKHDRLVLAIGARERFLPFPGWTLPNVMGAGGLQAMVKSGLPIQGQRVVVAGSGPLLLAVAAYLREHGAHVLVICEQQTWFRLAGFAAGIAANPAKLGQALQYALKTFGIPFRAGCWPTEARGDGKLQAVTLSNGTARWELLCDYLACGFHLVPNIELPMLLGCRIKDGFVAVDNLQRTSIENVFCAGEPTGIGGLELSLLEGEIAGAASAGDYSGAQALAQKRRSLQRFADSLARTFEPRPELKKLPEKDTIICRCEDVPLGPILQQRSWRSAKIHTRCGMGPCQGRICGTALEFLLGWNLDSVRPPIFPTPISCLAKNCKNLTRNTTKP